MKSFHVGTLFAFAIAGAACAKPDRHPSTAEASPVVVSVAVAHEEPLPVTYVASGTVRGRNTTVLTSKTMGYVRAVRVRSGDAVTAGQPLVDLEANDVRASVARARAGLDQSNEAKSEAENALVAARANAKIAKSSFDRTATLFHDNAIPQQQYDEAEARWKSAEAQEQMAQARVRSLGSRIDEASAALGEANATLGYSEISAPFAGRVLERRVDPGALAAPGMPLLVIADDGALRVEAAVEESRAGDVAVGGDAEVRIDSLAEPIAGKIGEIVPNVDVASRAFLVKIDLPANVGALRSGMFARASFPVGVRARLVVPTTALTSFGALDRVFVVDGARAHLRMVTRGEAVGSWTEILSGLAKDERVVATPPGDLRDGTPVEVKP